MKAITDSASIRRVAIIGNYTPRQCGIATFTADLTEAISARFPDIDCFALAMNDRIEGYDYPEKVRHEITANDLSSYRRAADYLNRSNVDLVCLQHEYGIYGGEAGSHILMLLRELEMPVVTTLHTILREPDRAQYEVMREIAQLSSRLVVMSKRGAEFLQEVHSIDTERVDLIHHGIPNMPPEDPEHYKRQFGVAGKSVILTFGLLSPDKGVENVIAAMPAITERFPDVVYIVLGVTHPHVRKSQGEAYRESLECLAQKLGVEQNVHFHNRYVSLTELTEFLGAADIYITPYLKRDQITSGTLAYAVGCGKAVISTPYYYAEELLADGHGVLVPWRDPEAISGVITDLLADGAKCSALQKRAAHFGREMVWPAVADRYRESFGLAASERKPQMRMRDRLSRSAEPISRLPALNLSHLNLMTDDTGLLQHASYHVPNYDEGYCIDDNARALLVMTLLEEMEGEAQPDLTARKARYLAFVRHAFNAERGRFRNFLSYDRRWLEAEGSEDSHGRTLWALGSTVNRSFDHGTRRLADHLFQSALPAVEQFTSPRAWAYTLLGIDEHLRAYSGNSRLDLRALLAGRLLDLFLATRSSDWIWFEDVVTYSNARLPQALIVSGRGMARKDMTTAGLQSLEWLLSAQKSEEGFFTPIGSNGFWVRGETPARYDQQAIEACGAVSACREAYRLTGDPRWNREVWRAFNWFLGQNDLRMPLYDPKTGGCYDGLHPDRTNMNQGAESTLSFLQSLLEMRSAVNRTGASKPPAKPVTPLWPINTTSLAGS